MDNQNSIDDHQNALLKNKNQYVTYYTIRSDRHNIETKTPHLIAVDF